MAFPDNALDRLQNLLGRARATGADTADALYFANTSLAVTHRMGTLENLERAESSDLGLRVFVGKKQAVVSSSDTSPDALTELVERAVAMARNVPDDPHSGIAAPEFLAGLAPELELCDTAEPSPDTLGMLAARAEDAARAVPGVTNSEGAEAQWSSTTIALAASNGFARTYRRSSSNLAVSVLAGEGMAMERDYDFTAAVFAEDLRAPEDVGRSAGERAVRRLAPRRPQSARVPVVFDPRASRSLIGHLAAAINGAAVARGTTFLLNKMGESVFPEDIVIVDDPLRRRGLRSRPFDGEGLATARRDIVENGVLKTWLLDLRSARQLGLAPTGHGTRGTASTPSPTPSNLYLAPGEQTPAALMADIPSGLYVTELMGFGVNAVTGDYSRGGAGFWIENGKLAYPVSELTIAGNLNDMFANLRAADDLVFRYGTDAPTVRIDGMTVAGT